ncbi:hypothetical protein M409DRAFT_17921 [Zasmidium cellare ATCC 36951]|uniref:PPPDE domain-containing protein n=1 Tax=Zasmidium cellare ATCC 36951 TaxID=1080233 RepID=A0A6A6CX17_ZASCE|nr:uncharacterized protein M409DRAFT_17921 [Zasmidium cellare ATCC 36951]KAF2171684.1 hypothetical protein M409DRAFT_17921 [Zasmidium cellare ATCC 36951]
MASTDDCPCSSETVGHPTSGPICPRIEALKALSPSTTARPVRLEFRFAKNKDNEGFRSPLHRKIYEMTGKAFEPAMHWALQVGSKCFDLHKVPFTKAAELRTTDWEISSIRFQAMKEEAKEIGVTYDQIEQIGKHIIEKAFPRYDAFINNCQSFVIELSKNILQARINELHLLSLGYRFYKFFNGANKMIRRNVDKIAGKSRALEDLPVALINRGLRAIIEPRNSIRRIKATWKARLIGGPAVTAGMSHDRMGALSGVMGRASRLLRSS